jgi:hypothetical protein
LVVELGGELPGAAFKFSHFRVQRYQAIAISLIMAQMRDFLPKLPTFIG